jgi:hypothetical protein
METMGEDGAGMDTMGSLAVVGATTRAAARQGHAVPSWAHHLSGQGVSRPAEELENLPFDTDALTSTISSGAAEAFPQRPFRGERLVMSAIYFPAAGAPFDFAGAVIITPAIYVGAVQVGASQGGTPLSTFAATAFGVRMSFPPAGQGTRIYIPYGLANGASITLGDSVAVTCTLLGRAIR